MKYVVVGGGIAGVSCAYELLQGIKKEDSVTLISASKHVKTVSNWVRIGQFAEYFTVSETQLFPKDDRFTFINIGIKKWDPELHLLKTESGVVSYDRLCIATGGSARLPWKHPRIISLRDSHSVTELQHLLKDAKHVALIGNGGIATELVYELQNIEIDWIIRDVYPSSVFFLPQIFKYLEKQLLHEDKKSKLTIPHKSERFTVEDSSPGDIGACALGPDWNSTITLRGFSEKHSVTCHCSSEVLDVKFDEKLCLKLTNQATVHCDFAIWAIGVEPSSKLWKDCCSNLELAEDGGISVDEQMKTSIPDVFASGDVCTVNWPSIGNTWKQMRLWTQARQMGSYCARSMLAESRIDLDFCFEMFAHVTYFCGMKVVLLGDFKAEKQQSDWYVRERIGNNEYVCCVLVNHRVVGATLIGDTHLEETVENLILNETDLSQIEEHFLDPGIDIEDYFD